MRLPLVMPPGSPSASTSESGCRSSVSGFGSCPAGKAFLLNTRLTPCGGLSPTGATADHRSPMCSPNGITVPSPCLCVALISSGVSYVGDLSSPLIFASFLWVLIALQLRCFLPSMQPSHHLVFSSWLFLTNLLTRSPAQWTSGGLASGHWVSGAADGLLCVPLHAAA